MPRALGTTLALLVTLVPVTAGCGDEPQGAPVGADAGAGSAAPPPSPELATAPGAASAEEAEVSTRPVELLKLVFTSDVRNKEPVDRMQVAKPGQKVWAHLTLRNRSGRPRKVHVVFRVGGAKRTEIALDVGDSWAWRTWAFNTVLEKDAGAKLTLEVTDDEGHPVAEAALPITSKAGPTRPR